MATYTMHIAQRFPFSSVVCLLSFVVFTFVNPLTFESSFFTGFDHSEWNDLEPIIKPSLASCRFCGYRWIIWKMSQLLQVWQASALFSFPLLSWYNVTLRRRPSLVFLISLRPVVPKEPTKIFQDLKHFFLKSKILCIILIFFILKGIKPGITNLKQHQPTPAGSFLPNISTYVLRFSLTNQVFIIFFQKLQPVHHSAVSSTAVKDLDLFIFTTQSTIAKRLTKVSSFFAAVESIASLKSLPCSVVACSFNLQSNVLSYQRHASAYTAKNVSNARNDENSIFSCTGLLVGAGHCAWNCVFDRQTVTQNQKEKKSSLCLCLLRKWSRSSNNCMVVLILGVP